MMKKLLRICLVAVLAAAFMATTVLAAGTPSVSVSSATAEAGETVTLDISIANNPGFVSGKVTLSYDTSVLELISMQNVLFQGVVNPAAGIANHAGAYTVTDDGTLVTATFKVLDTAAVGSCNVSVSVSGMRGADDNLLTVSTAAGTVTVTEPECEHVMGNWTVTKAATCTAEGEETRECENCDYFETRTIAKLAHTYGEWKVTKEATCTEKGVETRTCTCGAEETREIAAKGHTYGKWTVTKAATCTEKGVETRTCICGAEENREIAAKGHSFGGWITTKEATCTAGGEKIRKCDCGYTETAVTAAAGHTMHITKYDENYHWKVCSICGLEGAKEAHSFENSGMCSCGYQRPATGNDAELDDVPKTGDITPVIAFTSMAMICMIAAAAFVIKRKVVK